MHVGIYYYLFLASLETARLNIDAISFYQETKKMIDGVFVLCVV